MSTPPLFLAEDLPDGDAFALTGDEGRHAARVRRLGAGERLLIGDGRGTVCACTVTEVRPDGLVLRVEGRRREPPPDPRLVVVQALAKGERSELAVEVLTELGADEIVPWTAARSIVQWRGERGAKALARWRATAREAAKQSRRAWLPTVTGAAGTAEVATRIAASAGLVLHESADRPLTAALLPATGELIVVVGPEGGIDPDELVAFATAGAEPVRMGDPVLRTSTAGAAALAVLSARIGRWR